MSRNALDFNVMISAEYKAAKEKHPKFCDILLDKGSAEFWHNTEIVCKEQNKEVPYYGDRIMMEELAEAYNAYHEGDKEHAIQELAQCGAVILRMMEFVQNEINGVKNV